MGVRILSGSGTVDTLSFACLYDSTTETAFGPVYHGADADEFEDWAAQYEGPCLKSMTRDMIETYFFAWLALPKCEACDKRLADAKARVGERTIGGSGDVEQDVPVECGVQCDACWEDDDRSD